MKPAMPEQRMRGRVASPGLAHGPVRLWEVPTAGRASARDAADEAGALQRAIDAAMVQLEALAAAHSGDAAQMLQFQVALLRDEELGAAARQVLARGSTAEAAWCATLDLEIAGYEADGDEHFRARASDLRDVKWQVLRLLGEDATVAVNEPGCLLFAQDLPPSAFLALDWSQGGGIVLAAGSSASHLAMLARSRGVPMIVGTGTLPKAGVDALLDGEKGVVVVDPGPSVCDDFRRRLQAAGQARTLAEGCVLQPALTRDGTRVEVLLNVTDFRDLVAPEACDGIGLVRSEFLFGGSSLPDEQQQYEAYARILRWAAGRQVTIRTLDAGGDKPIAGLDPGGGANPALGLRGVRLSLAYPEVLRVQLRALARAASHGPLRVMVPMVTVPQELAMVRGMLEEELAALAGRNVPAARPTLGMMVEVPAAALTVEQFDAGFVSIGSNDLVQYTTAAARDLGSVADLAQAVHPAVLELVERVVSRCAAMGRDVSVCGDAAADPAVLPALLALGVRSISVAPAAIATIKSAIRATDLRHPDEGTR